MNKRYIGIDGLRCVGCIAILAMHMAVNNKYEIDGFIYNQVIPSFTDFTYLFMAISAFSMCCRYYASVLCGEVDWTEFYKKRYCKILPFFAVLIVIDWVMNCNASAIYEGLVEMTLLHGFIPQDLSVIGVGWFLGIVFLFYLIFPFFCVLLENRYRAWFSFAVSLMLNYICLSYFELGRKNFVFSLCYFIAGGLVFLYKDDIKAIKKYLYIPAAILLLVFYYLENTKFLSSLLLTTLLLMMGITFDCWGKARVVTFISGISMEIYLSHMAVFRGIEIFQLNKVLGRGWSQYIFTVMLVLGGTIVFASGVKMLIGKIGKLFERGLKSRKGYDNVL